MNNIFKILQREKEWLYYPIGLLISNYDVPTPMYFKGVLTDGGGKNEFISATPGGRSNN